jgi:hypothetical protein
MITNNLYFYKHVLSDMGIYFSKKKRETYIFVKLFNKMKQKIKQLEDAI